MPSCPDTGSSALAQGICLSSAPYNNSATEVARGHNIDANGCPSVLVETEPLLHRCIPTSGAISDVFDAINADGTFTTILNDLSETWQEMLYLCLVAVGRSFGVIC